MAIVTTVGSDGRKRRRNLITRGATNLSCSQHQHSVTGYNEAAPTLADFVFNLNTAKMSRMHYRQKKKEEILTHLSTTFEYQLWYGDQHPFGKPKAMTGLEAKKLNDKLEIKFFEDKRPDAHLWRWYRVGSRLLKKGTTLREYQRLKFERSST